MPDRSEAEKREQESKTLAVIRKNFTTSENRRSSQNQTEPNYLAHDALEMSNFISRTAS